MKVHLITLCVILFQLSDGIAQNPNPTKLIEEMQAAVGSWDNLHALKDVSFTYDYHSPQANLRDVSTERYIFEGEHSWAEYTTHQINVMPQAEGVVIQALVDGLPSCSVNGKLVTDKEILGGTDFLRRANYFWFVMNFKLNDPGTIHAYVGEESLDGTAYHKVRVTYDSGKTGKPQNDGYLLYINKDTKLVDQFYFSLPAMGVNEIAIKMKVDYETFNGVKLPVKRYIYMPGKDGKLGTEPGLVQTSSNIKFNSGFTPADFKLKG
ncbi:MAG: DUF6503 family protein [Bacteroidota bacterium]